MRISSIALLIALVSLPVHAAEPVARLTLTYLAGPRLTGGVNAESLAVGNLQTPWIQPFPTPNGSKLTDTVEALRRNTFMVYTTAEVDSAINEAGKSLESHINARLDANEGKLRGDVVRAVDALPQRVLSETAAQAIKDAVLQQIRDEMKQMRKELEDEIARLQKPPAAK